jgi:hypothetical protein
MTQIGYYTTFLVSLTDMELTAEMHSNFKKKKSQDHPQQWELEISGMLVTTYKVEIILLQEPKEIWHQISIDLVKVESEGLSNCI